MHAQLADARDRLAGHARPAAREPRGRTGGQPGAGVMTDPRDPRDIRDTAAVPGPASDRFGNPVFDPSSNVYSLVQAAIERQDDLRTMEAAHVRELGGLRAEYQQLIAQLRADFTDKLRESDRSQAGIRAEFEEKLRQQESARIDAIRAVDVGAVSRAAEVSGGAGADAGHPAAGVGGRAAQPGGAGPHRHRRRARPGAGADHQVASRTCGQRNISSRGRSPPRWRRARPTGTW